MKSYTDLEQSKKLAEFLPIESADMYYFTIIRDYPYSQGKIKTITKLMDGSFSNKYDIPCWSLSALIQVLPITIVDSWTDYCLMLDIKAKMPRYVKYGDVYHPEFPWDFKKQSLLDSVVESIFWLHNNNYLNGSNR